MKFKKSYFTKESFQGVCLDIHKEYGLIQFLKPLIELYKRDGIFLEFDDMRKMLTGSIRQTWSSKDKNTDHYLFLEHDKVDGNTHYIVNKNFDWNWYDEYYYKEERFKEMMVMDNSKAVIKELDLLRTIANMINEEFKGEYGIYKETLPDNIVTAIKIWNEKFNN